VQGSEESGRNEIQRRVNSPYIRERTGFSSPQVQRMKGMRWKCKALMTMQRQEHRAVCVQPCGFPNSAVQARCWQEITRS